MYLLFIYSAVRNGFEAGKIHFYEGYWKGLALEIVTFMGPESEMATSEASAFGPKKWRLQGEHSRLQGEHARLPPCPQNEPLWLHGEPPRWF